MQSFLISLSAILLLASGSLAQSKNAEDKCKSLDPKAIELISQYKELREKRRRLPQGEFDEDLQADGGSLSRILSELGVLLGQPPQTKQIIKTCLGEPDAVKNHRQMKPLLGIYERELKKAGHKVSEKNNREYLIYFWRGWHDFIFFISEDGLIVDHGWWFAYE
jgi:hypothetical protein